MKAIQILGEKASPKIVLSDSIAKPIPRNSEILIKVHAAGVTYDEIGWTELYQNAARVPGHEISGVIVDIGRTYDGDLKVGQEVYAFLKAQQGNGQAEYTICSAEEVALKPSSLSHAEAAAMPIPLLTAWEAIVDHAKIRPGVRVLVTGASGAVGRVFIQFVQHLVVGVEIIAIASSRNHKMLKMLGVSEVLDYKTPRWESQSRDVDVVFDAAGGDVLAKSWEIVNETGTIVTIADPIPQWGFGDREAEEAASHPGVKYKFFIVSANRQRLEEASKLIDKDVIRALPVKIFTLDRAVQAWSFAQQKGRDGKVVVDMSGRHD